MLGLLAVLGNVPDAALPPEVANGLPQLLSGLVRLLLDLKEQQDEAAKAADSEEDDDDGPVRGGAVKGAVCWAAGACFVGRLGRALWDGLGVLATCLGRALCAEQGQLHHQAAAVQLCLTTPQWPIVI